jgi:hypothetical protein
VSEPSVEVSRFLSKLDGVRSNGTGFSARCPCRNDDQNPSLSIGQGSDGRVLVTCHRGTGACSVDQICDAVGLTIVDLMPPAPVKQKLRLVETYDYCDAHGELLFQKLRYVDEESGKKTFRQRKRVDGEWQYSLGDTPKVLYNLPAVAAAIAAGQPVWVVEGEKDANALIDAGYVATTMPGGAGKWLEIHTDTLAGGRVGVVCDNDTVGREHAARVIAELTRAECRVRGFQPAPGFKDIAEMLGAGKTVHDLEDFTDTPTVALEASETVEVPDTADDPFEEVVDALGGLVRNTKLSVAQKVSKAHALLDSALFDGVHDTLDVRDWYDFVHEDADDSYDWVIPGLLERTDRVIVVAAEGVGKRATIDSVIPTPSGWTTLGDIAVGDKVIDRFGNPVNVTYVSPIEPNPDAYRVTFSDGNYIDADAEHQWYTETLNEREKRKLGSVRTTKEILDTLISNRKSKALNHAIPTTKPLNLPETKLPIPPYTLGAWLGDGTTIDGAICSEDDEILEAIRNDGYVVRKRESTTNMYGVLGLQTQLKEHGLYNNKHIPAIYSRASYEQRLALVQGLMDTDGYVATNGLCEFAVNCQELAKGFLDLIQTLGIKATMRESDSKLYGRVTGTRYRVSFKTDIPVCRLKRKVERLPKKLATPRSLYRYIVSVEPITPVPMRCISVDGPDNTYLIGDAYIPTHNTMLARQVAICTAFGVHPFTQTRIPKIRTLTIDLENPTRIIRRKSRSIMDAAAFYTRERGKPDAHIVIKPSGMNLLKSNDRLMFEQVVEQHKPDILFIGPLYKAFIDPGGRSSESVATEIIMFLDYIRETYQCALWMEQHAPLGQGGNRDLRPFGSAVWSRWPEFGISLERDATASTPNTFKVGSFRGDRDERHWPTIIKWGTQLPFDVVEFRTVT